MSDHGDEKSHEKLRDVAHDALDAMFAKFREHDACPPCAMRETLILLLGACIYNQKLVIDDNTVNAPGVGTLVTDVLHDAMDEALVIHDALKPSKVH